MLIPRTAWGAAAPKYPVTMTDHKDLFIAHHAAASGSWPTPAEEIAAMRFWQAYHQGPAMKGADIYYGAVIFPSGQAYEGRTGGWLANNGGAYGCNTRGFGVCMAGNFNDHAPTVAALDTLIRLALEAKDVLGLPADRYWGHRDCAAYDPRNRGNDCPGQVLYDWLPALRNIAAGGQKEDEEMLRSADSVGQEFHFTDLWLEKFDYWLHVQLRGKGETNVLVYATTPKTKDDPGKFYPVDVAEFRSIKPEGDGNPNPYYKIDIGTMLRKLGLDECTLSVHAPKQPIVCALREF
jgi:hypothetical protein